MNLQIQWTMFSPHLPWILILFNIATVTSLFEILTFLGFHNTLHTLYSNTLPLKIMLLFTSILSSAFFVPQICFYILSVHFVPYTLVTPKSVSHLFQLQFFVAPTACWASLSISMLNFSRSNLNFLLSSPTSSLPLVGGGGCQPSSLSFPISPTQHLKLLCKIHPSTCIFHIYSH